MSRYQSTVVAVLVPLLFSTSSSADYEKGQEAYSTGVYDVAIAEWQPLAEAGDAGSQFGMGQLYGNGFGVPIDDALAIKWYQLAAEQGHAGAQCNLAVMHANGWGLPMSNDEAFKWYILAAEQGLTQAQLSVAKMYIRGYGVEADNVQAYKWYTIASELGDNSANYKRNEIALKMSPPEIASSEQLAADWLATHEDLQANE